MTLGSYLGRTNFSGLLVFGLGLATCYPFFRPLGEDGLHGAALVAVLAGQVGMLVTGMRSGGDPLWLLAGGLSATTLGFAATTIESWPAGVAVYLGLWEGSLVRGYPRKRPDSFGQFLIRSFFIASVFGGLSYFLGYMNNLATSPDHAHVISETLLGSTWMATLGLAGSLLVGRGCLAMLVAILVGLIGGVGISYLGLPTPAWQVGLAALVALVSLTAGWLVSRKPPS